MTQEGRRGRRAGQHAYAWACCALAGALAGCARAEPQGAASETVAAAAVLPGIDVVLAGDAAVLQGRVGLITNHTGLTADGRSSIDALHGDTRVQLVALFGPEHGLRGTAEAGETIADGRDEKTGLPVHSLYGTTNRPTAEMLREIDVLVFDIQDIGTRYYTYVWTMAVSMQAAAQHGKRFVVLDRPNPIGGEQVHGNVVDSAHLTFVGLYPVPMRHGMTAGELARYLNIEHGIGAELSVVPVQGWSRRMWFDETGLPWVAPSPNMPSLESATHYPGTCLFEGTNLSVGRGTPLAFQHIGAPWLNAEELARRLNARNIAGVRFEATTFTPENPGDGKYGGETIQGVRFVTTNRAVYDPTVAGIAAVVDIQALHGDQLTFREAHFDRLAGSAEVRRRILDGGSVADVVDGWEAQRESFVMRRAEYLLYR